jgi:Rrf2 family protein
MSSILRSSDAARLAMHAAVKLAGAGAERRSAVVLARELGVSAAHMAKVLGRLEKAGLVLGTRGPNGGYVLARPAREVTLAEVLEAIEGSSPEPRCPFDIPACDGNGCLLAGFFRGVDRKVAARLSRTCLSDVHLELRGVK